MTNAYKQLKNCPDSASRHLDFRIIHRIIGIKHRTCKFTAEQDKCTFCEIAHIDPTPQETIEHLFFNCPQTSNLLEQLRNWEKLSANKPTDDIVKFLIYQDKPTKKEQNTLQCQNSTLKSYIWSCQKNTRLPNIEGCKRYLTAKAKTLEHSSTIRGKTNPLEHLL